MECVLEDGEVEQGRRKGMGEAKFAKQYIFRKKLGGWHSFKLN